MSFEELRTALMSGGIASYMVQRLDVHVDLAKTFAMLSSPAQSFVSLVAGSNDKVADVGALHSNAWTGNRRILSAYSMLSADQRIEALVYFTLPLHEFLHHIDMLQTPFGVMFHLSSAREYAAFEQFAHVLVHGGPDSVPPGRMIDLIAWLKGGGIEIGGEASASFQILARELRVMESWGDFDRVNSALKVVEENNVLEVLNRRFLGVRVNDAWSTFAMDGVSDWYARPATILEGRAVIMSILWASNQIAGLDSEGADLAHFMGSVYPPGSDFDYRFLPDLAAWWCGMDRIEDLLLRQVRPAARFVLSTLYGSAWIALHTPPIEKLPAQYGKHHPPGRFMACLTHCLLTYHRTGNVTLQDITAFDQSPTAQSYKLPDVESSLAISEEALPELRHLAAAAANPEIRRHFLHSADLLQASLASRKGNGYSWPPGFEPDPLNAVRELSPKLLEPYRPGRTVDRWLDFRRRAFFRPTSARKLWPVLSDLFWDQAVTFKCVQCAQQLALNNSKFPRFYRLTCPCGCQYNFPRNLCKDFASRTENEAKMNFRPFQFPCICGATVKGIFFDENTTFSLGCLTCEREFRIGAKLMKRLRHKQRVTIHDIHATSV